MTAIPYLKMSEKWGKVSRTRYQTALDDVAHNFLRHHDSLRVRLKKPQPTRGKRGTPKRWMQRTPAMGAGITHHRWTMEEMMAYPIIKSYR